MRTSDAPDPRCVTILGTSGNQVFVPQFTAQETSWDGRIGLGVIGPKIYVVGGYALVNYNYGYPNLTGLGFGLEKVPNLDHLLDIYGSFIYYPVISGKYNPAGAPSLQLQYIYYKYQGGISLSIPKTPISFEAGYLGTMASRRRTLRRPSRTTVFMRDSASTSKSG